MKNAINLLPKKTPEETRAIRKNRTRLIVVFALFLILLSIWGGLFLYLQNLTGEHSALAAWVEQKEQSTGPLAETERIYKNVWNKAGAVDFLFKIRDSRLKNLNDISSLVFTGVDIEDINLNKDHVKLTVVASDIASITEYLQNLEDENKGLAIFKSLTINSITIDKTLGYEVKIEGVLVL